MIDKKISISEDVANLSTEAQLLFTWMIPHADDVGLLPYSSRSIKALVVPMKDWSVEDIGNHLESIQKVNLIEPFEWGGDKYWKISSFLQHQTLKRDRKPQSIAKGLDNWNTLDSIWKTVETQVSKEGREESNKDINIKNSKGYKELQAKFGKK